MRKGFPKLPRNVPGFFHRPGSLIRYADVQDVEMETMRR